MVIVSYDISDDKLRTKFAKFLEKFGSRMQYSVFSIHNSERVLANIEAEIKNKFEKRFKECDSVYIFHLSSSCKITTYGYARHDNEDMTLLV